MKKSVKIREPKPIMVGGCVRVDAGPDSNDKGWYVGLDVQSLGGTTWLYPREARRLAKALLRLAEVPRKRSKP